MQHLSSDESRGYVSVAHYRDLLLLKTEYKKSFIYNYKSQLQKIASILDVSDRTVRRRINEWRRLGLIEFEGKKTLRLLSNTRIREQLTTPKKVKRSGSWVRIWDYTEVLSTDLTVALYEQPISELYKRQEVAINLKKKKSSSGHNIPESQSDRIIRINKAFGDKDSLNEEIFISQRKAAEIMGYRSHNSGYIRLKRLKEMGLVEIRENLEEIDSYDEYMSLRKAGLAHKIKKNNYCFPNTVTPTKLFSSNKYRVKVDPRMSLTVIERYSCTNHTFLDNY